MRMTNSTVSHDANVLETVLQYHPLDKAEGLSPSGWVKWPSRGWVRVHMIICHPSDLSKVPAEDWILKQWLLTGSIVFSFCRPIQGICISLCLTWIGFVNMSSSVESFYNPNFDGPTRILRSIYPQVNSVRRYLIFHSCSKRKPTFLIKLSFQSDLRFPTTAYFNESREHEPVWFANLPEIAGILGDRYGLHKQKCLKKPISISEV